MQYQESLIQKYEDLSKLSQYDQDVAYIFDIRNGATTEDIAGLKINQNGKYNANDIRILIRNLKRRDYSEGSRLEAMIEKNQITLILYNRQKDKQRRMD